MMFRRATLFAVVLASLACRIQGIPVVSGNVTSSTPETPDNSTLTTHSANSLQLIPKDCPYHQNQSGVVLHESGNNTTDGRVAAVNASTSNVDHSVAIHIFNHDWNDTSTNETFPENDYNETDSSEVADNSTVPGIIQYNRTTFPATRVPILRPLDCKSDTDSNSTDDLTGENTTTVVIKVVSVDSAVTPKPGLVVVETSGINNTTAVISEPRNITTSHEILHANDTAMPPSTSFAAEPAILAIKDDDSDIKASSANNGTSEIAKADKSQKNGTPFVASGFDSLVLTVVMTVLFVMASKF